MPKRFRFRLERLLELRRMREEIRKKELAEANRAVAEQQQAILRLIVEEEGARVEMRGLKTKRFDLAAVRMTEHFLLQIARRISEAYRELQSRQMRAAEKRRELVEATQAVRVLERFRERKLGEYELEVGREEQRFLDEVAARVAQEGTA